MHSDSSTEPTANVCLDTTIMVMEFVGLFAIHHVIIIVQTSPTQALVSHVKIMSIEYLIQIDRYVSVRTATLKLALSDV